ALAVAAGVADGPGQSDRPARHTSGVRHWLSDGSDWDRAADVRGVAVAVPANALRRRDPLPRSVRLGDGRRWFIPRPVGGCGRFYHHAAVRAAALPAQDRDDPARSGLAAESLLHRLHLPVAASGRLGLRPGPAPPKTAQPLFLVDRPPAGGASPALLRA